MRSSELALGCVLLAGCGAAAPPVAEAPQGPWERLPSGTSESLRGLTLVSSRVIWASGTHGTVIRSVDGGASFDVFVVPGGEALDFRSLHAWDADRAVVLSAGSPAQAFVTRDGGGSWTETYHREGEGVFFDSLVFQGQDGLALGDPLPAEDGPHFALLVTHDGGAHWEEQQGPLAEPGEAAFAASNACIALPAPGTIVFAAGGTATPRVFRSTDDTVTWTSIPVPMAGAASAGIFALGFSSAELGYAVGGDYAAPTAPGAIAVTHDGGASWSAAPAPRGYRSSVAAGPDGIVVVGTSGSDLWSERDHAWRALDDHAANTVRAMPGELVAVGPDGYVARMLFVSR